MEEQVTPASNKIQADSNLPAPEKKVDANAISWTASEFIAHSKTAGWYAILIAVTVVFAVLAYFFTDPLTTVVVVILALIFGFMASKKPRELPYSVSDEGVRIGKKLYPYESFKSFSIVQEEGIESIWFMPLQRFAPGLSIYFAPQEGQKIVDYLGQQLPYEERKPDTIDQLMHRIRF